MVTELEFHTKKIIYSIILVALNLTIYLITNNSILSFVITLNVFYFTREILFNKLFIEDEKNRNFETISEPLIILEPEAEVLPNNIKNIIQKNTSLSIKTSNNELEESNNHSEQLFISAIQKAEILVTKKINEFESRRIRNSPKIEEVSLEIKSDTLKNDQGKKVKQDYWDTWVPLALNDKFTTLAIYCEKCDELKQLQNLSYEVKKEPSYYQILSSHQQDNELHKNNIKVTLDSFEILSKPTLTVSQIQEVEA